jgi:hypothetical protein
MKFYVELFPVAEFFLPKNRDCHYMKRLFCQFTNDLRFTSGHIGLFSYPGYPYSIPFVLYYGSINKNRFSKIAL